MTERDTTLADTAHVAQGTPGHGAQGHSAHGGYEADRTPLRPILIGVAVVLGLLAIGIVVPTLLQPAFERRDAALGPPANPLVASSARELPPAPRLQVNPWRDVTEYRAAQEQVLSSYGWVDRGAGIVHIPIERAIDILAQRRAEGGAAR